ncbi:MAG: hypothetical protein ABIJ15_03855 [bacterium]
MKEDKESPDETVDIEELAGFIGESEGASENRPEQSADSGGVPEEPVIEEQSPDAGAASPEEETDVPPEPAGDADAASAVPESADVSREPLIEERPAVLEGEGGDIDDLIKKYEELPPKKDEPAKPSKAKFKLSKKNLLVPAAALAVVLIAVVALKFLTGPSKKVKAPPAGTVSAAKETPPAVPKPEGLSMLYPSGAVFKSSGTEEGINLTVYETNSNASDIKLFYQKKMAELGYEISSGRKNVQTFNMSFSKGEKLYNISVIPRGGKNVIVLSRPVGI